LHIWKKITLLGTLHPKLTMHDPTNSKYRYLVLNSAGKYRRFIQAEKEIESLRLVYQDQNRPAHGSYGALLFTPQWRSRRQEILARDANKCVICTCAEDLQVHHRQYHFIVKQNQFKLPWEYADNLLITLCDNCHKRGHNKFKVPIINI
jgi:5-methylcytosine-specific restriction endonuclease McrA